MKRVQNYQSFFEGLFTKKIESEYFYSERLRSIFTRIYESESTGCRSVLINGENTNQVLDDITLFDIGEDDSTITFIQTNRLQKMKEEDPAAFDWDTAQWIKQIWRITQSDLNFKGWKEQRTSIGIGKFITRLFKQAGISIKDSDKENLVNSYKSFYKQVSNIESNFELVSGEDIRKWYLEDRYQFNRGELSNSCMRYERCQKYLDIYVKNPEVCSLLILKGTEPDKIVGRALVWKLSKPEGVTYMDRIYTNVPSDRNVFINYAKKMNWYQLSVNNPDRGPYEVQLGDFIYDTFPYMDSFSSYNIRTHILTNTDDVLTTKEWYELQDTRGGFTSGDRVYSEYHGDYISTEDAVYCQDLEDYMRRDEARYLEYKDIWVSLDSDSVFYSNYSDSYYLEDDVVFSDYVDDYIYIEQAAEVHTNVDDTEWVPEDFFKKGLADIININDEENVAVLSDSVMIDPFTGKWVYKKQSVMLYWSEELKDYITEEEAEEKKLSIDKGKASSEWYSEYLTRKIGQVDSQVLYDYLKNLEPTPQELERIDKYFEKSYRYNNDRIFTTPEKFQIIKWALYLMIPDENRRYSFRKIIPGMVRSAVDDSNKEMAQEFLNQQDIKLYPKYLLNINDFSQFMTFASSNAMNIIKDKEALKTYVALKYHSKS
jgi:hypothetical protein